MLSYKRDGRSPIPTNEFTSKIMRANKGKNTSPELALRSSLRRIGVTGYRIHWKKALGNPDIAFPGKKIAIFIHGDFWHQCPVCNLPLPKTNTIFWKNKLDRNVQRDDKIISTLKDQGWLTIVIWEHEIKADSMVCALRIKDCIDSANFKK